jgi:hypothetical protein
MQDQRTTSKNEYNAESGYVAMNDTIVIQQVYPGLGFEPLLELTQARHQAYCEKWQMDYKPVFDNVFEHDPQLGSFAKIQLIKQAQEQDYPYIIWLDADTIIADMKTDLRAAIEYQKIGACWQRIPQLNHWNVGALYVHNCEMTKQFINEWLKVYPPQRDGWNEQGVFNRMAMQGKIVTTISDRWNATLNHSMVPDAVVLGFHGYGIAQERLDAMQLTLKSLETREGAR